MPITTNPSSLTTRSATHTGKLASACGRVTNWPVPSLIEWAFLAIGLFLVIRYLWILDDSFIYFRYVDNHIFLDRGLVFNEGEFVEGYSSPLWLMLLIVLRQSHLDFWSITAVIACVGFCVFWYACVVINNRFCSEDSGVSLNFPLIFLSTAYGVTSYFSSGSESPLVQLAAALVGLYSLFPQSRRAQIALGFLPLVRNEFVVPLFVLVILTWVLVRRVPWTLIGSSLVCGLSWAIFRIAYYAEFFPTPFYLKDKVAIAQGFYYLKNCFEPYGFHWILFVALAATLVLRKRGETNLHLRTRCLMIVVAASSLPYVIKMGGDMMHYRLLAFPFCLAILSMGGLVERCFHSLRLVSSRWGRAAVSLTLGVIFLVHYPWFLSSHPLLGHEERTLDHGISDAPWHRYHPALEFKRSRWLEDHLRIQRYRIASGNQDHVLTEPFCATMYNQLERQFVHAYGLTDPILARMDVPEERPAHKPGLFGPARELAWIRSRYRSTRLGLATRAISDGVAPHWMVRNEVKIRMIEQRMYNSHSFLNNFVISLDRIGLIAAEQPERRR